MSELTNVVIFGSQNHNLVDGLKGHYRENANLDLVLNAINFFELEDVVEFVFTLLFHGVEFSSLVVSPTVKEACIANPAFAKHNLVLS